MYTPSCSGVYHDEWCVPHGPSLLPKHLHHHHLSAIGHRQTALRFLLYTIPLSFNMATFKVSSVLLLLLKVMSRTASAQPPLGSCYYPNGQWASNQYPCYSYRYISFCCPSGWSCYSNQLCVVTDPDTANSSYPIGTTAQGTCTNPQKDTGSCGGFCSSMTAPGWKGSNTLTMGR